MADNMKSKSVAAANEATVKASLAAKIAGLEADLAAAWTDGHIMAAVIVSFAIGVILGAWVF